MKQLLDSLWKGLSQQGRTMTQKAVRGATWVGVSSIADQGLNVTQTMILTRLLLPSEFGIIDLAMVAMSFAAMITTTGINQACVQRKELDDRVLDTAWLIEMARNLLMGAALILISGPTAAFYIRHAKSAEQLEAARQLAPVMCWLSLRFVMLAFRNIGVNLLTREMNFKRYELYQRVITLLGTATTVVMAFVLRSFWALVIGQIVYGFLEMVGSYIVHPYRPSFHFAWNHARSLIAYGKHLFLSGLLSFVRDNLDTMLISVLLGFNAVGYYRRALSLAIIPGNILTGPIWTVTFPAFSRMQGRREALKKAFTRVLRLAMSLALPMYAGMAILAPSLVRVAYGENFMPAAPVFRVFCVVFTLRVIVMAANQLFYGIGKPVLSVIILAIGIVALVPSLGVLAPLLGANGAAWARGIAQATMLAITLVFLRREIGLDRKQITALVTAPIIITLTMSAILLPGAIVITGHHIGWLITATSGGIGIYFMLHFIFRTAFIKELGLVWESMLHKK